MTWQPIETYREGDVVLLYQPANAALYQPEGMVVGTVERATHIKYWVSPALVLGWEMECELENPTHWMPLPAPPPP